MKLAFYKASKGTLLDTAINIWTGGYGYSHVELVFSDGMSFSSSPREGEVRLKKIDFDPDKWEFCDLRNYDMDEARVRAQAENFVGRDYDWKGIFLWFVLSIKKQDNSKWWCSEIIAFLLKWQNFRISPNKLAKDFNLHRQPFKISVSFTKRY